MKISKFIHSCFLVEEDGGKLLIDPGLFTFIEGIVKPEDFKGLQAILITHNHPDHRNDEALQKLVEMNPNVAIFANSEMNGLFAGASLNTTAIDEGVEKVGKFSIEAINCPHAPLPGVVPKNTAFLINGKFLHTGDSLDAPSLATAAFVVAVPFAAPFATDVDILEFVKEIRPPRLVNAHDGHLKDFWHERAKVRLTERFKGIGVQLEYLHKPGESIEL